MLHPVFSQQVPIRQRINSHGTFWIQDNMLGLILWNKSIHQFLGWNLHPFGTMGKVKAVVAHIHGQQDTWVFSQPECHNNGIQNFLVILNVQLQPACITHGKRVLGASPQCLGRDHFTVGNCHDNRETKGRSPEIRLIH